MTIDLDQLESAAKAATQGSWDYGACEVFLKGTDFWPVIATCRNEDDTAFIAAANPAVVLELIEELRAKNKLLEEIFDDLWVKDSGVCQVCHTYTHEKWCWYPHLVKTLGKTLDAYDERFLAEEKKWATLR